MLIPRSELQFDFGTARFDIHQDRNFLGWVFNQFLYGEVTGIQCGHWLYRAPTLSAATFLSRQASEELSHVKRMIRILEILSHPPEDAHRAVKFLSTGMMGGSWGEHVCMEMALGEGLVLTVFYALSSTIENEEIRKIIESAIIDEEKHVEFGERETLEWLTRYPNDRSALLGQALLQWTAMGFLKKYALNRLPKNHPVLEKFSSFYDHLLHQFERRIEKLNLSDCPLREISVLKKLKLLIALPYHSIRMRLTRKGKLLTSIYLTDPWVKHSQKERT